MARILYHLCPYCQKRMTRPEMVNHIDRKHPGDLPDGFSPLRMTFHVVNKKPLEYTPKCRICARPTQWDEKKGRYNVLCDNPACRNAWIKKMKDTMGDKYGKFRPTETVEGLEKMLRGRKISGKYRFKDGVAFDYTGSYELEALKFMDQVLDVKSEDLQTPGPIMQYELKGELHYYIPDMYYIPYNLIIEVKDGGSRPNKNEKYAGTRERQMAKEKHVIEKTEYNYLRLTDKNMGQLLAVFADLKMQLLENEKTRVIHVNEVVAMKASENAVNENMFASIQGMMLPAKYSENDVVVVNYMKKNMFSGDGPEYAVAEDPKLTKMFYRNKSGKLCLANGRDLLKGKRYRTYAVRNVKDRVFGEMNEMLDRDVSKNFIYESVFGHKLYTSDQIRFEAAERYPDIYDANEKLNESVQKILGTE